MLVFFLMVTNLSHPHCVTIYLVQRAATLTFSLSRATVEPFVYCVLSIAKTEAKCCVEMTKLTITELLVCFASPAAEHCSRLATRM